MALTAMPFVKSAWYDENGDPYAGYYLFTYQAGTTTKLTTYTDPLAAGTNANPIILDSAGRAAVYLQPRTYKFVLAPAPDDPPTSPVWTADNIQAVPTFSPNLDVPGTFGESVGPNWPIYLSDGSGGKTAGRWYATDATNAYSSSAASVIGFSVNTQTIGQVGTVRLGGTVSPLPGLSPGAPYYAATIPGNITAIAPANVRQVGIADVTTDTLVMTSSGIISINGLSSAAITIATGTAGTDFAATAAGSTVTLNLPDASATARGVVTTGTQTIVGAKTLEDVITFGSEPVFTVGLGQNPGYHPGGTGSSATLVGKVQTDTTLVGNTLGAETNLMTYSVPADMLSQNGQVLRVKGFGQLANNGNTKTIKIYFGATSVAIITTTSANTTWEADVMLFRTGAATQFAVGKCILTNGAQIGGPNAMNPTETLSGAVTFKFTGTATATNDIVQYALVVETVG